jgi:hypothetical protein
VDETNIGTYCVIVTNALGSVTSSNVTLDMYPYLQIPFGGLDTYWGYTNTLGVDAWGSEPLYFQWYYDGALITNATNFTYTISDIQNTNAGLYSVVVSNQFGSVTNAQEQVVVNPAGVSLGLYPGLTITGVIGQNYIIMRTANLADTNSWFTVVSNLTLTQTNQLWIDTNINTTLPGNPRQFYQVLEGQ